MKTFIVTGASKGIGAAVVRSLRARGCRVVGIARSEDKLKALAAEKTSGHFEYVAGDICCDKVLDDAVRLAVGTSNSLDGLVLNAGIGVPIERVESLGMDEFFRAFQVNMFSGVRLCQVALPHLRKSRGGILFTSTGVVDIPISGWSAYCSSKAAMNMFLKCLAREEAANLSAVMCVRPGIVDTDILTDIYSQRSRDQVMDADQYQFMQLQKEKGKLLSPEEPADVMAQLIIKAPRELNGAFFAFNDENVKSLLSQ